MGLVRKTRDKEINEMSHSAETVKMSLLGKGPLCKMKSFEIYKELLKVKVGQDVYVPRISLFMNDPEDIDWCQVYERANRIPMDTKTKDFQYRFIHDILSNKYWLHKWKVKESAECTYCNSESETIEHLFWSCDQSQLFWNGVANVLLETRGPTQFTMEDIFIGSKEDENLSHIIFSAKRFLYNKKIHDEQITILSFKMFMKRRKELEFHIAQENNRIDQWAEKWRYLEDL
jgi:hypothetical protein